MEGLVTRPLFREVCTCKSQSAMWVVVCLGERVQPGADATLT